MNHFFEVFLQSWNECATAIDNDTVVYDISRQFWWSDFEYGVDEVDNLVKDGEIERISLDESVVEDGNP